MHRVVDRFYLPHALPQSDAGSNEINEPLWDDGGLTVYAMGQGRKAIRKICPQCWRQHRTLFLPWSLRHVTTCPVHLTLLIDRCVCGRPLKFNLLKARCFACHTSLDLLPVLSIADHAPSVALTELISSAIGYRDEFPSSNLSLSPSHPLWAMHPAALFRFLVFGAQLLAARYPDDPIFDSTHVLPTKQRAAPPVALHQADVPAVHHALLAIWQLLEHWPQSWHNLLARIAEREEQELKTKQHFPSTLFNESQLRGREFGWLHQEWGQFVYSNIGVLRGVFRWYRFYKSVQRQLREIGVELPQLVGQRRGRALVGMGFDSYKHYLANDELPIRRGYEEVPGHTWQIIGSNEVEQIQQEHRAQLDLGAAIAYLGIGKTAIFSLIATGLIQPEQQPSGSNVRRWRFTTNKLDSALFDLIGHLPVVLVPNETDRSSLPLREALAIVRSAGVGLPDLLQAARVEVIAAFRVQDSLALTDLRFVRDGERGLIRYRAQLRPIEGQAEYTSLEVCQLLGCTQTTLRRWWEEYLLVPNLIASDKDGEHPRYDAPSLSAFQQLYVLADEAAKLLGCHRATLCRWARVGRFAPALVCGGGKYNTWLFDRRVLETIANH